MYKLLQIHLKYIFISEKATFYCFFYKLSYSLINYLDHFFQTRIGNRLWPSEFFRVDIHGFSTRITKSSHSADQVFRTKAECVANPTPKATVPVELIIGALNYDGI
jgi:hypothetical protein